MPRTPAQDSFDDPFGFLFVSITELTGLIKSRLESDFAEVAVAGELSNVARPKSGHVYFSLKDQGASIRAVMWKSDAQRLDFEPVDGLAVRALGRLTVYAPRGDYQIVVQAIEPEGIGAMVLAFRRLHARLAAEGLFDPARKRPLPRFPRRIVIVTSPTGAAVRDFLQITGRRWPLTDVLIAPAKMQGIGSPQEIVAAIVLANRVEGAEAIVLARGGGSAEDLSAFNEEIVVRAIAGSGLPVVSAIGHEIDVTLADLAADRRALTPSEAGELCVPDVQEIGMHLDRLAERHTAAGQGLIRDTRERLARLGERAGRSFRLILEQRRLRLTRLGASLEALNPTSVLARGYSLTFQADGKTLVRTTDQMSPGDLLVTRLAEGELTSRVENAR
jgi:exodeoxyribonuclease VII large subunit